MSANTALFLISSAFVAGVLIGAFLAAPSREELDIIEESKRKPNEGLKHIYPE